MAGGLLNIVAYGNQNIILNGNPSKTFFKTTYAKYTNFGLQKFRLDFEGQKTLRENTPSTYNFTISRYADLLLDTYFVIDFPNIWSPIYMPNFDGIGDGRLECQPYEFKWIENLGSELIKKVTVTIGGEIIQEFTGTYMHNMVNRDFSKAKINLFNEMTGNVPEMNNPAYSGNNNGRYPTVVNVSSNNEPSIRARRLYIPLNLWYMLSTSQAFPLLCLSKNQLRIQIECRPIRELFVVRDMVYYRNTYWVCPPIKSFSLVEFGGCGAPDGQSRGPNTRGIVFNKDLSYNIVPYTSTMNIVDPRYQMYIFITQDATDIYDSIIGDGILFKPESQRNWYADNHLMCTYAFLGEDERQVFRSKEQTYLFRGIHERDQQENNYNTRRRMRFTAAGLVANWMWFFRRNDVSLRNQWSNYTNWAFKNEIPYSGVKMYDFSANGGPWKANPNPNPSLYTINCLPKCNPYSGFQNSISYSGHLMPILGDSSWGPGMRRDPPYFPMTFTNDLSGTQPLITGPRHIANQKDIMKTWGLWLDGKLRENQLDANVVNNVEKYARSSGGRDDGLYFYNFGLNTNSNNPQPTGAINLILFNSIEFEFTTIVPPHDLSAVLLPLCGPNLNNNANNNDIDDLQLVGLNKPNWYVHNYNYDLYIMEERYNLLTIGTDGIASLKFTTHN